MTKAVAPTSPDAAARIAAVSPRADGSIVGQRLMLPIEQIGDLGEGDYVGLIDQAAVECLKVRLAAEGLHTPIWVRKNGNAAKGAPFSVIAGRHRLLAATALGWSEIAAEVRAGPSSKTEELRAMQLVENLDRRELRPIERALFIMDRWQEAARASVLATVANTPTSQQSAATRQRLRGWDIMSHEPEGARREIDAATAQTAGVTDRTVRRYRKIFAAIVAPFPNHFALVNAHPLGASFSAIRTLAEVGTDHARKIAIEQLLDRDDWPDMTAVLVAADLNKPNREKQTHEQKLRSSWKKLTVWQKQSHFVDLAKDIPPSLVRETIDELKKLLP